MKKSKSLGTNGSHKRREIPATQMLLTAMDAADLIGVYHQSVREYLRQNVVPVYEKPFARGVQQFWNRDEVMRHAAKIAAFHPQFVAAKTKGAKEKRRRTFITKDARIAQLEARIAQLEARVSH